MLSEKCCICGEEVKSPYSYIQHIENAKSRIYTGHKRCLFLVPDRVEKGEKLEYTEFERPKL
jgi:hypothetical protein